MKNPTIDNPVIVTNNDEIICKSDYMEEGKLYEIIWKDEKWALRKTDKEIEFLKWESN